MVAVRGGKGENTTVKGETNETIYRKPTVDALTGPAGVMKNCRGHKRRMINLSWPIGNSLR